MRLATEVCFRYSIENSILSRRVSMKASDKKQILTFSIFIILLAQINLDIFASNFRVSMGVMLLPVLIFLYQRIAVLSVTFLAGVGVYLSRVLLQMLRYESNLQIWLDFFPELIFYLIYGGLFYLYFRHQDYKLPHDNCYIALFFMDYLANLSELLCRLQLEAISLSLQINILLVALIRTLIVWAVLTGLSQYKFLLVSAEHAHRYQRLILLISKLNSEVIWMHKNTAMIEDTMAKSYQLFSRMQEENVDPALSQCALNVAKDIHEVKKEYLMILRGISEALELNLQDGDMSLSDILTVLHNALMLLCSEKNIRLDFRSHVQTNFKTDKHYFLLSIFRNLFTNAVEANLDGSITLEFSQKETETDYLFEISDNGPGIPEENLEQIFHPGFSTKINFHTGEISRGLGLNLVEDVVQNQFRGSVRVESRPGNTTFYIAIPKQQLEVREP